MYKFKYIFYLPTVVFALISTVIHGGIKFEDLTIDQAIKRAKTTNKNVFVDTYATWCAPCKIMEGVFNQTHVGDYFNDSFINVRVNMDGAQGKQVTRRYEVVFLPTLLIISPEGEILAKIDRMVDSEELIRIAKDVQKGIRIAPMTGVSSTPFSTDKNVITTNPNPEDREEVIYVHDERASSGRPHIMYHEAYLHLQLQDGKHQKVVDKYLSTQNDWTTDKNIKFIFDFLQSVNSKYFEFFLNNKSKFIEIVGEDMVTRSLNMLVHQRLYQGYPRPSLKEATRLYNYVNPNTALLNAYQYYFERLETEGQQLEYIKTAELYLQHVNREDTDVIKKLVKERMSRSDSKNNIDKNIELLLTVSKALEKDCEYCMLLSNLYLNKGDHTKANELLDKAERYVSQGACDPSDIEKLKSRLNKL